MLLFITTGRGLVFLVWDHRLLSATTWPNCPSGHTAAGRALLCSWLLSASWALNSWPRASLTLSSHFLILQIRMIINKHQFPVELGGIILCVVGAGTRTALSKWQPLLWITAVGWSLWDSGCNRKSRGASVANALGPDPLSFQTLSLVWRYAAFSTAGLFPETLSSQSWSMADVCETGGIIHDLFPKKLSDHECLPGSGARDGSWAFCPLPTYIPCSFESQSVLPILKTKVDFWKVKGYSLFLKFLWSVGELKVWALTGFPHHPLPHNLRAGHKNQHGGTREGGRVLSSGSDSFCTKSKEFRFRARLYLQIWLIAGKTQRSGLKARTWTPGGSVVKTFYTPKARVTGLILSRGAGIGKQLKKKSKNKW